MIANGVSAPDVAAQYMHTCIGYRNENNPDEICAYGIEPRRLLMLLNAD